MQSNVKVAKVFARADLSFLLTVLEWCWILMSMAVLEWPGRSNEVETQLDCKTSRCTTLRWTRIIAMRCRSTTSSYPGDGVAPCCLAASWASTGHDQRAKLLSGQEDDAGKQQLASSRSNQALARQRTSASATATAVPHRVVTGPEPFLFTHVSCGKHHLATVVRMAIATHDGNYDVQFADLNLN
jgi:hypothetical protein